MKVVTFAAAVTVVTVETVVTVATVVTVMTVLTIVIERTKIVTKLEFGQNPNFYKTKKSNFDKTQKLKGRQN